MNNLIKAKKYTILVPALFLFSCSVPRPAMQARLSTLPERYTGRPDSAAFILPGRDTFFKDPLLQVLIRDVLQQNPDFHIALQRVKVAGAWLKAGKGALLPTVQAVANTSATKFGKHTMEGVGNYDTNLSPNIEEDQKIGTNPTPDFWLGLTASWELDIWGKLRKLKKAALMRYIASAEASRLMQSMLVAQTSLLYYELIALDNEALIIQQNITLQERAVEIVEAQKAGGRATELAVQQFKAQLLNTRSAAYAIRQKITEAENQVRILAGRYDGPVERGTGLSAELHFASVLQPGIPAQLLQHRPDILEAQAQLEASRADLGAARAAFFPSLNLSAYTAFNAFKGNLLFAGTSVGYQLFGGLTAPIFQKHELKARFRVADASQEQAFYHYRKTVLNAYREVLNSLSAIENNQQIFSLKKEEVRALEQGVKISNDLYVTGYASYLEIVSAQKSKLQAELELVNTQRSKMNAMVGLYQSLGGGWGQ